MAITVRSVPEAFQPYVLEVPWDAEEDGSSLAVVLVVIKKPSAVLLAAPKGFFAEETLIDGMQAGPDWGLLELFTVRARRLEEMDGTSRKQRGLRWHRWRRHSRVWRLLYLC